MTGGRVRGAILGAACAAALSACGTATPLEREVRIGTDAYAVLVGTGQGSGSDLYAVPGQGGPAVRLTWSPVEEYAPALSPEGGMVAFIRRAANGERRVWVLNLLNMGERTIELPDSVAPPVRVGWSGDSRTLYVRTEAGTVWRAAAPPAEPEPEPLPAPAPAADSALAILVGDPPFARIEPCTDPSATRPAALVCVVTSEASAPLAAEATSAARWGPDSVAYLAGNRLFVRPLGPGNVRPVNVDDMPAEARELTGFGGGGRGE